MTDEEARFDSIARQISRLTGYPRAQIGPDTRVYHDAGLSGLNYQEFLLWLSKTYQLDLTGLNLDRMSPPEVSGFGSPWPRLYIELSVADFVQLAGCGSLVSSDLFKQTSI